MAMTMQPFDFPNGHGQNDHDHNTIGITKWSWSNGQNYQSKIINFNNFTMVKNFVIIKFGLTIMTIENIVLWIWSWSNLD